MSDNVLILHPRDALYRPEDPDRVIGWLEEEGMIRDGVVSQGEHPTGERRTFRTGPAFAELALFGESSLAAAPVSSDVSRGPRPLPPADFIREVCRVVVVGPLEREWFLASGYTDDPRCPTCGATADWIAVASDWYASSTQPSNPELLRFTCSACTASAAPWDFDWQRTAAFARWYIEIWHIHRGQAQPGPALMDGLAKATGTPWSFIYYRL